MPEVEYFKLNPRGKELKSQIPLPVRLFGVRLDKIEKAIELGEDAIVLAETEKLKLQIKQTHPYKVPEIAELAIKDLNKAYLQWLVDSTL